MDLRTHLEQLSTTQGSAAVPATPQGQLPWLGGASLSVLPLGVLRVLRSRACRTAIM